MIVLLTQYNDVFYALSSTFSDVSRPQFIMLFLTLPVTVATCERSSSKPRVSIHRGPGGWAEAVICGLGPGPPNTFV